MATLTRDEIVTFIKEDLLLDRLGLGASGVKSEELGEETALNAPPLSLDSVDTLDLIVGVERKFSLPAQDLTPESMRETCSTIGSLTDYVADRVAMAGAKA